MNRSQEKKFDFTSNETLILNNLFPSGVVFLDVESTGLSPLTQSLLEVSIHKLCPDKSWQSFSTLVKTTKKITKKNRSFHGITQKDIAKKKTIQELTPNILSFIGNLPIVAHNAIFDIGFLIVAFKKSGYPIGEGPIYDSCKLARKCFKENKYAPKNFKLNTLANYYGIELNHHIASEDAWACAKIFLNLLQKKNTQLSWAFLFDRQEFNNVSIYKNIRNLSFLDTMSKKQKNIMFRYKKRRLLRTVKAIALVITPQGPALYGNCLVKQIHGFFLLNRISSLQSKTLHLFKKIAVNLLITISHLLMLCHIILLIKKGGVWKLEIVSIHYFIVTLYGTLLIFFTAKIAKRQMNS